MATDDRGANFGLGRGECEGLKRGETGTSVSELVAVLRVCPLVKVSDELARVIAPGTVSKPQLRVSLTDSPGSGPKRIALKSSV